MKEFFFLFCFLWQGDAHGSAQDGLSVAVAHVTRGHDSDTFLKHTLSRTHDLTLIYRKTFALKVVDRAGIL